MPTGTRVPARRASKAASNADSRAAYLVLVTRREGARALLFNTDLRYLTDVVDDPLTVDRLCSAGRRCDPPAKIDLDAVTAPPGAGECEVLCFALGTR